VWRKDEEAPEYVEGRSYTNREKELIADSLLRDDARSEVCRVCKASGSPTGRTETMAQPAVDQGGHALSLEFPEFSCPAGHIWFQGEGEARGIGGKDPILFEEHLANRRRREILPANGVPDPSIVAGIYNRTHPQGRKVNSEEQRKKNGASFFR